MTCRYSIIKWEDVLYVDSTSPSGLRWKVNRLAGKDNKIVNKAKDSSAGGIKRYKKGHCSVWTLGYNKEVYYVHRIIWLLTYGSLDSSLFIDHLDGNSLNNCISNLEAKTQQGNAQNKRLHKNNSTGVTGVNFWRNNQGNTYYVTSWMEDSRNCRKLFSVDKLGLIPAMYLAVNERALQISRLNLQGADYTDRHNKLAI